MMTSRVPVGQSILSKGEEREQKCKSRKEDIAPPGVFRKPLLEDSATLFRSRNARSASASPRMDQTNVGGYPDERCGAGRT